MKGGEDYSKWWICRVASGWRAYTPVMTIAQPEMHLFPSWREAYDYAHTHPSNRKETP